MKHINKQGQGGLRTAPFPTERREGKEKVKVMKIIEIGGKEYTIEYTIEASLYSECTEKITNLLANIGQAQSKEDIKGIISSMSDIPQTTLTMLYAGLLEKHGAEVGDGTITCKADSKKLIRKYFEEHSSEEEGNFFDMMEMLIDAMVDDDFFNRIGLNRMISKGKKQTKQPQDHKKKTEKEEVGEK